jgi:hypothetical protein
MPAMLRIVFLAGAIADDRLPIDLFQFVDFQQKPDLFLESFHIPSPLFISPISCSLTAVKKESQPSLFLFAWMWLNMV